MTATIKLMPQLCQHEEVKRECPLSILEQTWQKVIVTLDPKTAHPNLRLSNDLKSVRWESRKQERPDHPERFDWEPFLLGQESFTSGRHWWLVGVEEMEGPLAAKARPESVRRKKRMGLSPNEEKWEVEEKRAAKWGMWAVGVAKESVPRKGKVNLNPDGGIWALGKDLLDSPRTPLAPYRLTMFTSPERTLLSLRQEPKKIQVCLDYDKAHVAFFDADTKDLLATFSSTSFSGEKICPFFWVYWGTRLNC
nr:butyrophilin subfamily 1 member A1-like [Pogona vitticeps]